MTAILRQVDKTFTFEEQRVEINEIGLDLYNLKLLQSDDIELTDFTVDTATLASGGGSLSYAVEGTVPNQVGKFTFTPADVFSGDYDDLTDKPTKLSDFTDDLNYSIPSNLSDLDDVLITNETSNHYLKWNGTKWVNEVLNEIVVQKNTASTSPDLSRTITSTGVTLTYTPPDLSGFATKVTTDDAAPFAPYDGQLWWKSDEGKLKIAYQDPNSLQWVDASPAGIQLSDLTVNEKTAAATSKLEYDPATGIFDYTPTTAGSGTSTNTTYDLTAENGSDTHSEKIQLAGSDNTEDSVILAVDPNSSLTIARNNQTITFGSTSNYVVTDDVPPTSPSDGELWYNSAQGKLKIYYEDVDSSQWVDTNGGGSGTSVSDFTGATSSADGTAGLVIKPSAGDEGKYLKGDGTWATVTSGSSGIALTDLEVVSPNPPASGSGGLAYDNTNGEFTYTPPLIPYVPPFLEIADPVNNIDTGKVLKWNGTHWAPGTDLSGGGTGSAQEHDMWWLSTQSSVQIDHATVDRPGYNNAPDTIGLGTAELGDFGRVTQVGFAKSGDGMTELNGVFTFPTTGQWRVKSTVFGYARETGNQAGKFASAITYTSDYSTPTNSTYNTYLECVGAPKCSEQTAANNYTERDTYNSAVASTIGGGSLANIFDGDNATYVDMGVGHADMCYLWLSHAPITDAVKITVGFDGHGAIGYGGADSGIAIDSATLLRVDNGQAYGANGVTGSPTEIIVEDNTTNNNPIYSGLLQTLTFTEYPDANGTGGWNRGPGNRCHVYYIKIQRLVDNVLTEITYNAPASTPTWTQVNRQWSITNNSTYPNFSEVTTEYVFNITDTSTQKVKFEVDDADISIQLDNNSFRQSRFFFQKLEGGGSSFDLTSLDVVKAVASGDGNLQYDDAGEFTYTPPLLNFSNLKDTPSTLTADKWIKVNSNGDALVYTDAPSSQVVTDDNPPSSPSDGDLWYNSTQGKLKIYYQDVDSSQWVDTNGGGAGGSVAHPHGLDSDSNWNTKAGTDAGSLLDADCFGNTLYGYEAGKKIDSALANTLVGYQAGDKIDEGEHNVGLGSAVLNDLTSGSNNVAIGTGAVGDATTQEGNVGVGYGALSNTTVDKNTGVGFRAAELTSTGTGTTAVGSYALYTNQTGSNNTAIGDQSLRVCTGSENTALGSGAGHANGQSDATSGSNNTFIGYNSIPSSSTVSNEVTIGNSSVNKFRVPGVNFTVKDSTATENYVLTVDSNGEAGWEASSGGGASVTIATTAPTSASSGDLWWKSDEGQLKIYYTDVDSSAWIDTAGGGSGSGTFAGEGAGLVPGSTLADTSKYLKSDGSWDTPSQTLDSVLTAGNTATSKSLTVGTLNDAGGNVRSLPVNTQAAAYTIQTDDVGKLIKASGDITISSANALSEGDIVTIYNSTSSDINIERSSTDMYLVGDSTSQNRVLAQKGIANLVCVGTNEYVLMGGGIT